MGQQEEKYEKESSYDMNSNIQNIFSAENVTAFSFPDCQFSNLQPTNMTYHFSFNYFTTDVITNTVCKKSKSVSANFAPAVIGLIKKDSIALKSVALSSPKWTPSVPETTRRETIAIVQLDDTLSSANTNNSEPASEHRVNIRQTSDLSSGERRQVRCCAFGLPFRRSRKVFICVYL